MMVSRPSLVINWILWLLFGDVEGKNTRGMKYLRKGTEGGRGELRERKILEMTMRQILRRSILKCQVY
jgi:hypothetical protein